MPVPTADERAGLDTSAFPGDTLEVPVDPGIAAVLTRYPLPNYPQGSFGAHTYATPSKVITNANQFSLRLDHSFSAKDQFFARFNFDNLTGPTTNPDQTAIDPSFATTYIDRQRNVVGTYTRTVSPHLAFESSISITRSTPGFPTPNHTDPAVKFNDGLFEPFNAAAGSVMQAYGNLFQGRQLVTFTAGRHAFKAGVEVRSIATRPTSASAPTANTTLAAAQPMPPSSSRPRAARTTFIPAIRCPIRFQAFFPAAPSLTRWPSPLRTSPTASTSAPPPSTATTSAIYVQDTWKVNGRLTLDYGLRWDLYTPITERAHRTVHSSSPPTARSSIVINPQPGYQTNWHAWEPRVQISWQATPRLLAHAGGSHHDHPSQHLAGQLPHRLHALRRLSAPALRLRRAHSLRISDHPCRTSARLHTDRRKHLPSRQSQAGSRQHRHGCESLRAGSGRAHARGHVSDLLNLSGIDRAFGNATLYTWTLGLERKFGNLTADATYVGTAAEKLPAISFPNAYPGATPASRRYTTFDTTGNVTGGFGMENVITATRTPPITPCRLRSLERCDTADRAFRRAYTWSKSIDDTQRRSDRRVRSTPQNPFDYHPEKGPSSFDATTAFGLSVAQDLHLDRVALLRHAGSGSHMPDGSY